MNKKETLARRALRIMEAFPPDEPAIPIAGLSGAESSGNEVTLFRVCRLCGSLVLESMAPTHIVALNHDDLLGRR